MNLKILREGFNFKKIIEGEINGKSFDSYWYYDNVFILKGVFVLIKIFFEYFIFFEVCGNF